MTPIKQSLAWWCYARDDVTPEQLITEAAKIGYASIEMGPREHWDLIRENGMRIAIIGGHGTLSNGLNKRENHDRIEQEILANLEVAVEYDIPGLICFSGNREGLDDEKGAEITAEGLSRVAKAAEDKGVNLCLELLNSKVNHPDYQCDYTPWGVKVCEMVNSPRVKLLYDIYHMQIMEGDLIRTITDNIEHIRHFHTAGNPGRHDMDEDQEIYYPPIMRAIAETDYDLYVGHEFIPKGPTLAAIREAYELCKVD
ncbi:MAG: hydroxypyruvate isomerase family protein [Armatimonadota bacterium]